MSPRTVLFDFSGTLFATACRTLWVPPAKALMVGDDPAKDGGAANAGLPVHLLPRRRTAPRPRGLSAILRLVGADARAAAGTAP